jgi:hypothetical protein
MSKIAMIAALVLLAGCPATLHAQDVPEGPNVTQAADSAATAAPCRPKKKKGFGLGKVLKAANRSGLTTIVSGGLLGQGGMLAGAALNTGLGAADHGDAKPQSAETGC